MVSRFVRYVRMYVCVPWVSRNCAGSPHLLVHASRQALVRILLLPQDKTVEECRNREERQAVQLRMCGARR